VCAGAVTVRVDASVGIAAAPGHGTTFDDLRRHADVAMDAAKSRDDRVAVYDPDADPYSVRRLEPGAQLPGAISRGELVVFYQPIVDAQDGRPAAVEALVRWRHPGLGLLPPGEFLPIAVRTGMMGPLTEHVLAVAVRDAHGWQQEGLELAVACNLGPSSAADERLPAFVGEVLDR
jgi:predicted signal transduction protein with EAL and GGDEF domain